MKTLLSFISNNTFDLRPKNLMSKPEFGHSVWMILGQVFVSVVAFAMTYALANYVTEAVVGMFRFVLAAYAAGSVFALIGMNNALMQSAASGKTGSYEIAVRQKIVYGLFGSLGLCAAVLYYWQIVGDTHLALSLLFLAVVLPWLEAFSLFGSYLNGVSQFKYTSIFLSVERAVTSGAVVVAALLYPSIVVLVTTYFGLRLCVVFVLYVLSKRLAPPNNEFDSGMLPYAKHMTLMSMFAVVTAQLDKFVLFIFFGPVALATFWVASVIPQEVARFLGVVLGTFFPRVVQLSDELSQKFVQRLFLLLTLISMVGVALYSLVAELLFTLFLPVYIEAVTMSVVLMLAYAVTPHVMVWNLFTAKKKVRELYYYSVGEPVLVTVLYALFIPLFGVWGLVYAVCARTLVLNTIAAYLLYFKRL